MSSSRLKFGKKQLRSVSDAAGTFGEYADPLVHDEKLRKRLVAALAAGAVARERVRRQRGIVGTAGRLVADPVLRAQLAEVASQLQSAKKRAEKAHSHKLRNTVLFLGGVGLVVAAVRRRLGQPESASVIEESIEVNVPVATAYNQWTQFEEFPRFMEGVDEVRKLDDSLLHWAATVGGKHAEWDAKIVEQEPDTRIAWESIDGKETRGTVSFEPAGPERSRVRLRMSYRPEGVVERVGSTVGLDNRRVRGDLGRFRDLVEERQAD